MNFFVIAATEPQSRNLSSAPKIRFRLPVSWHGAGYGRNDNTFLCPAALNNLTNNLEVSWLI